MRRAGATGRVLAALLVALVSPVSAFAGGPVDLAGAPPGAVSCSGCHAATVLSDATVPPIAGRPAGEIEAALAEFRAGTRPATIMNRIAPGFTPAEARAIAAWIGRQTP